jgi:hypothetical protein
MNMLYLTIGLFALSAVLGVTILYKWLTNQGASRTVVFSHGIAAAVALVILILYAVQNPENVPTAALILFVAAALGGFYMFALDMKKKNSPMAVAYLHALLAVSGFVALLLFAFA